VEAAVEGAIARGAAADREDDREEGVVPVGEAAAVAEEEEGEIPTIATIGMPTPPPGCSSCANFTRKAILATTVGTVAMDT
jgi:hypothetical protein